MHLNERTLVLFLAAATGCGGAATAPVQSRAMPTPEELQRQCKEQDVPAQVVEVADGVWIARGFDLATTVLVKTAEGNVIVDVTMNPERGKKAKAALQEKVPGKTRAIIYTHSHLDHIGGASAFVEEGTEIWATDAFFPHLMKQYNLFRPAETLRVARQWGLHLDEHALPCSAIGHRVDLLTSMRTGIRKPTHTFSGRKELIIGGVRMVLVEAHGETHDQLFVWLPDKEVLLAGDNYYASYPNIYTVRGTSPRPVDAWIDSLDKMRRYDPRVLIPAHTGPIVGRDEVREVLTNYRDVIQWTRDAVVRGANQGWELEEIVSRAGLPPHLTKKSYLLEMYGQVDWSARAIYTNKLGWFDGRADRLYPADNAARREVELMGGPEAVRTKARAAMKSDPRWALHLFMKLKDSKLVEEQGLSADLATCYEAIGEGLYNTNGRAYLLESAYQLRHEDDPLPPPVVDEEFLRDLPLSVIFENLPARLKRGEAQDIHESVQFHFTDTGEKFVITARYGVAEVVAGEPLPGTPAPVARVEVESMTWRRLAVQAITPLQALGGGGMKVENLLAFRSFMDRFEQGM